MNKLICAMFVFTVFMCGYRINETYSLCNLSVDPVEESSISDVPNIFDDDLVNS